MCGERGQHPCMEVAAASSISVVIPALNEEKALPQIIAAVQGQVGAAAHEVLVVDGGSCDRTSEVAAAAGARVISAPRGRDKQMNAGAKVAQGDALLFLHADTELPPHALTAVQKALQDSSVLGGCFTLRFDTEDGSLVLWFIGFLSRFWLARTPWCITGDRAIFVRRSAFEAIGGYGNMPVLEELDFVRRLARSGGWRNFLCSPWGVGGRCFKILLVDVQTAGRRFDESPGGPLRQFFMDIFIVTCWQLGVSEARMRSWYLYLAPAKPKKTQ